MFVYIWLRTGIWVKWMQSEAIKVETAGFLSFMLMPSLIHSSHCHCLLNVTLSPTHEPTQPGANIQTWAHTDPHTISTVRLFLTVCLLLFVLRLSSFIHLWRKKTECVIHWLRRRLTHSIQNYSKLTRCSCVRKRFYSLLLVCSASCWRRFWFVSLLQTLSVTYSDDTPTHTHKQTQGDTSYPYSCCFIVGSSHLQVRLWRDEWEWSPNLRTSNVQRSKCELVFALFSSIV